MKPDNNDKKSPGKPELPPEVKAEMKATSASVQDFIKRLTFFIMHQISFADHIRIEVAIKDRKITGFHYSVNGEYTHDPQEEKKDG